MRMWQDLEAEFNRVRAGRPRWERQPSVVHDVNVEHQSTLSRLDRVAMVVTDKVGTMGFFLIILSWTVIWLAWNILAPAPLRFDPYPGFVLWLFISNLIQIHLMPLIMIGQNLQGRHAELRAQNDYEVNQKAEVEVEQILTQLEHQARLLEHQGELILHLLRRLEAPPQG